MGVEEQAATAPPGDLALDPEKRSTKIDHEVVRVTTSERQEDLEPTLNQGVKHRRLTSVSARDRLHGEHGRNTVG
jgi:hypothetical protein